MHEATGREEERRKNGEEGGSGAAKKEVHGWAERQSSSAEDAWVGREQRLDELGGCMEE